MSEEQATEAAEPVRGKWRPWVVAFATVAASAAAQFCLNPLLEVNSWGTAVQILLSPDWPIGEWAFPRWALSLPPLNLFLPGVGPGVAGFGFAAYFAAPLLGASSTGGRKDGMIATAVALGLVPWVWLVALWVAYLSSAGGLMDFLSTVAPLQDVAVLYFLSCAHWASGRSIRCSLHCSRLAAPTAVAVVQVILVVQAAAASWLPISDHVIYPLVATLALLLLRWRERA